MTSLKRRRDRLTDRLRTYKGNPTATNRELGALLWAIRVIEAAQQEGVLDDLSKIGFDV